MPSTLWNVGRKHCEGVNVNVNLRYLRSEKSQKQKREDVICTKQPVYLFGSTTPIHSYRALKPSLADVVIQSVRCGHCQNRI